MALTVLLPIAVMMQSQTVGAATWSLIEEISTDTLAEKQLNPSVAVSGAVVHVVWQDEEDGDWDIFHRYFNGSAWQPEEKISSDIGTEDQVFPEVAVYENHVHTVWEDTHDIHYRHFNGTDWQPELEISSDSLAEWQMMPSIAVYEEKVHVVWQDVEDGDWDIRYRQFNGTDWQPELEISTDTTTENQVNPSVATYEDEVYVAWQDEEDGDWDIHYRHFNGTAWQPELEISTDSGAEGQFVPVLAGKSGSVHVAWHDQGDGDMDIYCRYFNGTAWQPEVEISTDIGTEAQANPAIAMEESRVHVMWMDEEDGDWDIYYRYHNGTSWQPEQEVSVDSTAELQRDPSLAVYEGHVHLVWTDGGGGDLDILHRTGTEDVTAPTSNTNPLTQYWQTSPQFDIDWTASDDCCLASIFLFYRCSPDNSSWSPWTVWEFNDTVQGMSANGNFSFGSPNGDGFYEFYTIADDSYGNRELEPSSPDLTTGLDTTPPTGSLTVNEGRDWANSTSATLGLTYSDSLSGVSQVRYSNDGVWDDEVWEPPSVTRDWNLTSGDEMKTVYYQTMDNAGLESSTYSDNISLDTEQPTGSIIINGGDEFTTLVLVNLSLSYSDSFSGIAAVRYGNDGIWDTEPWEAPSQSRDWTLNAPDGIKTVYFQTRDNASLLSDTYSDDIILDTTAPTVKDIVPSDLATNVEVGTNITLIFSERMNESATEGSFSLLAGTSEANGSFSWDSSGTTLSFTPSVSLKEGATYGIVITTSARDTAGNSLTTPIETAFTTEKTERPAFIVEYWWVLLILILSVVVVLIAMMMRGRRRHTEEEFDNESLHS